MSTYGLQPNDIDISDLEEEQDPERLVQIFGQLVEADSDFKIYAARQWLESFLYFGGIRESFGRFQNTTITGRSLNMPFLNSRLTQSSRKRRVSKVFKAMQVQAANVTRQKPSMKVWPESENERSVTKAKLSNIILDYLWEVDCEDDLNYEALLYVLMTPAIARKDYMDFRFNKTKIWPVFDRDQQGNVVTLSDGQPSIQTDSQGNPKLEQLPSNRTELVSAFRLIFNPSATWQYDLDYVGDVSVKRHGWIMQNFNRHEEGYHPERLADVKKGQTWKFTPIMAMENALKQLSFGAFRAYRNWNYSNAGVRDGVTYVNFFIEPSPNYPMGREICIANAIVVYDGKSRVYREDPVVWNPHSFLCYERIPGRLWGTTYGEKITDINRAYEQGRTEFDQLRRTFSKPKMILPTGAQIDRDTITGDEQVFRYNAFGPDGGKPAYLAAPQPPTTIIDDLKLTAQDFTEMSGITEIMQGIRPQGVTTYRGLEVLREEATNASNNLIRMYENFVRRGQANKLENFRMSLVYPDKTLANAVRIFKKMRQYITDIDIKDFAGDSIGGYVTIEPYSSVSKSKLSLQEKYMSLANLGVLGDIVGDPDLNQEFKRKMDVTGFDKPQDRQVLFARYENSMMLTAEEKQTLINPKVQPWHDDPIHIKEIDFLLLDPALQSKQLTIQSLLAHRQQHEMQDQQKQAQAQAQAIATGQALQGGEGGGQPLASRQGGAPQQKESGDMFGPETGHGQAAQGEMV